jgi:uncharacterized repeat protein (TIGR01451 family)
VRRAVALCLRALAAGPLCLFAAFGAPAHAAAFGTFNLTGSVSLSATTTDFLPAGPASGAVFAETFAPQSGSFAGIGGTTGLIFDYTSATVPVGAAVAVTPFLALAPLPGIAFELTFLQPGVLGAAECFSPPAAGQGCTPPGSAFNFANSSATSSMLSFTWEGEAHDGLDTSTFVATVTTQFTGLNYQQVLAAFAAGSAVSGTFSATFVVATTAVEADLEISKTDGLDLVARGDSIAYTIVVHNPGPSTAINAPVTDDSPAALENVAWTCTATPGSQCGAENGSDDIATTVTLLAGGSATFVVTADVAADATGTIVNTATVGAGEGVPDPDTDDNSATDSTAVRLPVLEIPTLGGLGLGALSLLLAGAALRRLRRRASPTS